MIKIKVHPEDFIVEEVAGLPMQKHGNFCVYLLKKRGWNTVDVLKRISQTFSIPFSDLSYGGKKDKYAITSQYITIARQSADRVASALSPSPKKDTKELARTQQALYPPTPDNEKLGDENYSMSLVGLMDRPMGPDLITGNSFQITVRNVTDADLTSTLREIECVKNDGYPNYFDDQRFGSFDARQGFIAEKIIKKHYNGALRTYFSSIHPEDSREEKEYRKYFYENWGNWQTCLKGATSKFEKEAFRYLKKRSHGFVPILQRISHEKMGLFFSAYQSHLWNELLRKIIHAITNGNSTHIISKGKKRHNTIRNKWLVQAMVGLNMIDSLGYGIYMINTEQRKRFLPLTDYILNDKQRVVLQVYGNVIDENYSKLLIERADLPLMKVILLDKVQKKHQLTDDAISLLRREGLIEGRKPNIFVSATLAKLTGKQVLYTKRKPFEKQKLKDWVLKFLDEHRQANRKQIDELLCSLLPEDWTTTRKKNKIANLLSEMKREGLISNKGNDNLPCWVRNV